MLIPKNIEIGWLLKGHTLEHRIGVRWLPIDADVEAIIEWLNSSQGKPTELRIKELNNKR
jgi:hypothetical protein